MHSLSRLVISAIICSVFAINTGAEVIPSVENDKKAEDMLIMTLKAKRKDVLSSLDEFKTRYNVFWKHDKGIRASYLKLDDTRVSRDELCAMSDVILNTMVTIPYRHPLKDGELRQAVFGMCFHTDEQTANQFMTWLSAFSEISDERIDSLMPVLIRKPEGRPLLRIPVSEATRKKYQAFFNEQVEIEKKRYDAYVKDGKQTTASQIVHLRYCAQMGDEASLQKLITLFGQLRWDGKDGGSDFRLAMKQLLEVATQDAVIAVLKRFRENAGSPEYRPGASPRAEILKMLLWRYPDDAFFESYRDYLASPFSDTILDSAIGGSTGVEKLYSELQTWVQKRFGYKLDLEGAEAKIKAIAAISKFFKK